MGIKRNNAVGVKGRSGRRPLSEELIKRAAELNAVEISQRLINRHLLAMEEDNISDIDELAKIAIPIKLKDMTDKTDLTSGGKPIFLPSEIINKHNINDIASETKDSSG